MNAEAVGQSGACSTIAGERTGERSRRDAERKVWRVTIDAAPKSFERTNLDGGTGLEDSNCLA